MSIFARSPFIVEISETGQEGSWRVAECSYRVLVRIELFHLCPYSAQVVLGA